MIQAWQTIERWLKSNAVNVLDSLNDGASPEQITAAEHALGINLPESLIQSLRIHNGQLDNAPGFIDGATLLSIERVVEEWKIWKDLLDRGHFAGFQSDPDFGIKDAWWNPKWTPITYDGTGNHLCIDSDPAPGGIRYQLITLWHDDAARKIIAPSFEQWLSNFADDLTHDRYVFSDNFRSIVLKTDAHAEQSSSPIQNIAALTFGENKHNQATGKALLEKAKLHQSRKEWQQASDAYSSAMVAGIILTNAKERAEYAVHLNNHAWSHAQLKQFDRALEIAELALQHGTVLVPRQRAFLLGTRGYILLNIGKYASAIEDFTQALRLKPDHGYAYWYRGVAHEKNSDPELAKQDKAQAETLGFRPEE